MSKMIDAAARTAALTMKYVLDVGKSVVPYSLYCVLLKSNYSESSNYLPLTIFLLIPEELSSPEATNLPMRTTFMGKPFSVITFLTAASS